MNIEDYIVCTECGKMCSVFSEEEVKNWNLEHAPKVYCPDCAKEMQRGDD